MEWLSCWAVVDSVRTSMQIVPHLVALLIYFFNLIYIFVSLCGFPMNVNVSPYEQ